MMDIKPRALTGRGLTEANLRVLVTGATGYVGGRLVPRLLERGYEVRVLVRDPGRIEGRDWEDKVEVFVGDLLDASSLRGLGDGIEVAYYLVHSMEAGLVLEQHERDAVENFSEAMSGKARIVYLGNLLPESESISRHDRSRAEVGRFLRDRHPTLEIQVGPVIGSGSVWFEMIRFMTEHLPVMVTPRWMTFPLSPVAVRDVLAYLLAAIRTDDTGVLEVGSTPLSFVEMISIYADVRKLRRIIVRLPLLTRGLSVVGIGLVTPISKPIAEPIVNSLTGPAIGNARRANELFPDIEPITYRTAVELALVRTFRGTTETRWSGALGSGPTYQFVAKEGLRQEVRSIPVAVPPGRVFRVFTSVGGDKGWFVWGWLWRVRGIMDTLVGGPGLRRGRRHPQELMEGETVDFWRVELVEDERILRLRAEMRMPGEAWLQWEAIPEDGGTRLVQTAVFAPSGLVGFIYWYSLFGIHKFIFSDMVAAIAREAEQPIEPRDPDVELGDDLGGQRR